MDYAKVVDEPPTELPAQPPNGLWPGLPKPEHDYPHVAGYAHEAGYGTAHYLKLTATQYASYNFDWGMELNESDHGCLSKPPVEPQLFEEASLPFVSPSLQETRLQ